MNWRLVVVVMNLWIGAVLSSKSKHAVGLYSPPKGNSMYPVELDSNNFTSTLKYDRWVVLFYEHDCIHCLKFMNTYIYLSDYYNNTVRFGRVDCLGQKEKALCNFFKQKDYPDVKLVKDGKFLTFKGSKDADSLKWFFETSDELLNWDSATRFSELNPATGNYVLTNMIRDVKKQQSSDSFTRLLLLFAALFGALVLGLLCRRLVLASRSQYPKEMLSLVEQKPTLLQSDAQNVLLSL